MRDHNASIVPARTSLVVVLLLVGRRQLVVTGVSVTVVSGSTCLALEPARAPPSLALRRAPHLLLGVREPRRTWTCYNVDIYDYTTLGLT